jgi:hypothetical protein
LPELIAAFPGFNSSRLFQTYSHNTLESHYKMSSLDEVEIKVENFAIDIADYERCYHEGPSGAMLDRRAGLTNYWSQIKFELAANGLNAMILSPNIRDQVGIC